MNVAAMIEDRNSDGIAVDNRIAWIENRGRHGARIPDTRERQRLERQRGIRQIVFGAQDGVLTTLGIVTGVGTASQDRATIVITGLLSLLVGALSMGVGEYLGGKSEREVVAGAIELERREMFEKPEEEYREQIEFYRLKGFTDDEAEMIVRRLEKNPEIWLHEMVRDEFGIDLREADDGGFGSTFSMMTSFAAGAAGPVVPYLLPLSLDAARYVAFALAALVLFAIGAYSATISGKSPLRKGFEIVAFGLAVFAISFVAGHLIPPLLGRAAVGVGG